MGLAAQSDQDRREAGETDGNLRESQQGIRNVYDKSSRRPRLEALLAHRNASFLKET